MEFSPEWAAWAAGLFEGEGTVTTCGGRPRLAIRMTDEQPVRRFADVIGSGRVYGPYENRSAEKDGHPRQPTYMWVAERDVARQVASVMLPWLCDRRLARIADVLGVRS